MTENQFNEIENEIIGAIIKTCKEFSSCTEDLYAVSNLLDSLKKLYDFKKDILEQPEILISNDCEILPKEDC